MRLVQIFWPIVVGIAVAIVVLFCMLLNGIFGQADGTVIFTDVILGLVFVVLPLSALTLMILGLMRLAGVKSKAQRVAPQLYGRRT